LAERATDSQVKEVLKRPPQHSGVLGLLEPISKSFEEDDEAGKLDKAEEIVGVVTLPP
jgi:hypothetical protein